MKQNNKRKDTDVPFADTDRNDSELRTLSEMKKNIINQMKLEIDPRPENERLARSCVVAFVMPADPTVEELTDLRTAVSEAVTNSIVHGYGGLPGKITLTAALTSEKTVIIKVKDGGRGIDDIKQAMRPLFTTDTTGERGGMGFAIMESFTDRLTVRSTPGRGTTVTMVKRFGATEKTDVRE